MDQSDNRTVKFVVSCCVVSKQVKVSTILASVESTGSWLHAGSLGARLSKNWKGGGSGKRGGVEVYTVEC